MPEQSDKASSVGFRFNTPTLQCLAAAPAATLLRASCERLGFFWRFRERNHLSVIHLAHGIGDLGSVLFSGKAVKEIREQKQSTGKRQKTYDQKHSGEPSGERLTVCPEDSSPAMGKVA